MAEALKSEKFRHFGKANTEFHAGYPCIMWQLWASYLLM